jgi:glycosyltransferase involved in cell wall biosynthesis
MRILQLSSARHFGGGERHFVDLTNALIDRGHDLFAAVIPDSPLLPELSQIPTQQVCTLPFRNAADIPSAWKLRNFVRDHQIEIVHAHVGRDYPLAALAAGSGNARLVLTRHVMFPLSRIHRLTRQRVSRVIAVSESVAESIRAQKIFHEHQITVVNHGIDLAPFEKAKQKQPPSNEKLMRVGMLGELSPVKGQQDFVRAAAIVAAQRDDVEFQIAGEDHSDDGHNQRDLKNLIEGCGLGNRVRIIDSIVDVPSLLADLDVFVSASHSEAFGLAIVEAMAGGVPVVATMTGGAREIIKPDRTGRLVPIGDAKALAHAIIELLSDDRQRETFAANARKTVAERFSLDRMVAETEKVYWETSQPRIDSHSQKNP